MPRRILVVDDDPDHRMLAQRALRKLEGVEIATAESGEQALRALRDGQFDAVVADHNMPMMTGLELLDLARRERPGVYRILVTATDAFPVAIEAINRAHVHAYLPKSGGFGVLGERLEMLFQGTTQAARRA